jgi:hypothetical protein
LWIQGLYYNTYKNNTFIPIGNQCVYAGNEVDYAKVTDIDLNGKSLTTNFSNVLLSKFVNINRLLIDNNQLTLLDVTHCPSLTYFLCFTNLLTLLDVTNCPSLTYLRCSTNLLTLLDVTNCPSLTYLNSFGNQLTLLDVSNCPSLTTLICFSNQLGNLVNSQILIDLDSHGLSNGYFRSSIFGGGTLTAEGITAKSNLQGKGWTIVGL